MDLPPAVRKVKAVDLAERHIKAVELRGTSFEVEIRPAEILSFEFLFG